MLEKRLSRSVGAGVSDVRMSELFRLAIASGHLEAVTLFLDLRLHVSPHTHTPSKITDTHSLTQRSTHSPMLTFTKFLKRPVRRLTRSLTDVLIHLTTPLCRRQDVNAIDAESGLSPLHEACLMEDGALASLLVSKGADREILDASGESPTDLGLDELLSDYEVAPVLLTSITHESPLTHLHSLISAHSSTRPVRTHSLHL